MTDRRRGEKSLPELEFNDLNIHLYLTLNYGTASEHLDFDFMVLYNAFVISWGLTITQNSIHTISDLDRSRLSDTRSAENDWIGADTDPEYRIDASLVNNDYRLQFNFDVGLVLESVFKTFPMRRRSLKASSLSAFRSAHSLVRAAFKVYSAAEECGRTSSTHAKNHQLDLRGLKKLPALGLGVRLSASPLDDENYVIRTVCGCGRLKYTLALILICACVWSVALRWNSGAIW